MNNRANALNPKKIFLLVCRLKAVDCSVGFCVQPGIDQQITTEAVGTFDLTHSF